MTQPTHKHIQLLLMHPSIFILPPFVTLPVEIHQPSARLISALNSRDICKIPYTTSMKVSLVISKLTYLEQTKFFSRYQCTDSLKLLQPALPTTL